MTDPKIKPGFILIIPKKPPFELPKQLDKELLKTQLKGLGLAKSKDYIDLYTSKKLDEQKIRFLFDKRGGPGATARRVFPHLANPDGLIDFIQRPLRIRRDVTNKNVGLQAGFIFNAIEEHEPPGVNTVIIDGQKAPPGAKKVTKKTNEYLKKSSLDKTALKKTELTDPWLTEELPRHIRTLAEIAAFGIGAKKEGKGIIFHEPHHDLSPGMLLINEIFTALLSRVADLIEEINGTTERMLRHPDLTPLSDFVDELSGMGDTSNEFTNFILPGGRHKRNGKRYRVDPTRVELFLDGGWIYGSAVIVGAWKGGTHSNGATHTS